MAIDDHLRNAIDEIYAALADPASMRVMERNALNLALGHVYGVLDARKHRPKSDGAEPARVDGDPKF